MNRRIYFALFLLSGFCGLTYQVVWVRLAFAYFGVITPVLSVVISVFMLGMGIGSWLAGRWSGRRETGIRAVFAYGLCEAGIGLSAWIVPFLFKWGDQGLLPHGSMDSGAYLSLSALTLAAAILPWCVLMGATVPLMMRFIQDNDAEFSDSFSYLYLANVIGALLGTILTADVLIELLGFHRTLAVAGITNFGIAATSFAIGFRRQQNAASGAVSKKSGLVFSVEMGKAYCYTLLFITGFISMGLEVVWTRAFTPILSTTIYAFALVLAVYLLATAVGSSLYRRHLGLRKTWTLPALLSMLALSVFWTLLITDPRFKGGSFFVELGIFPFCFFLGYLTPQLIDLVSGGDPAPAGQAYAVNIAGCILGPLVASYIMLPDLGVKNSLLVFAVPFVVLYAHQWSHWRSRWRAPAGIGIILLGVTAARWSMSHEEKYPGGIVRRDYTATVISAGTGMDKHLYVNGQGITVLTTVTKTLAHLPLAFHPQPVHNALTICFGMGTTYRSLLSWGIKTTAVELVPSVRDAFGYYHANAAQVLADPNGHIVIDDGRRFLRRTQDTFDVITIDPPPPIEAAGSSLLYSREMYTLIRQRLAPGGILQQWFFGAEGPEAQAIARSLMQSFPYIRAFRSMEGSGIHFLASDSPLPTLGAKELAQRLPASARQDLLEWEPTQSAASIFQTILVRELSVFDIAGPNPQIVITDDRPYNEYYLLRRNLAKFKTWIRGRT